MKRQPRGKPPDDTVKSRPAVDFSDYWPCACHKGSCATLQIKMNHKSVKRCKKCKSDRPDSEVM